MAFITSSTFVSFFCFFSVLFSTFSVVLPSPLIQERGELPLLELPYATYRAARYEELADIYVFNNIRYAAPPVGDLRWAQPSAPEVDFTIQDGSYGHSCLQAPIKGINVVGDGNQSPIGTAFNQFLGGIPLPLFSGGNEDCLFLDIFVPGKAIRNPTTSLPVLVFIHGGAFVFGSKDSMQPDLPFYDGSGMITQSNNNMIFVSINYRLGAYGFLAGTTMEEEGLPNAGLHDQRAALMWVRDHIGLVGGDGERVTVMGESAGAGSIIHHLVAEGGTLNPLFERAVLLSPAYEYLWDRDGQAEDVFWKFAALAGCANPDDGGLDCLRAASAEDLQFANTQLHEAQMPGSFAVGPMPDGKFIRQLPVLELRSGNFFDIPGGMILSHVKDEAMLFVDGGIASNEEFEAYVGHIFPNYTKQFGINEVVTSFYPPVIMKTTTKAAPWWWPWDKTKTTTAPGPASKYQSQSERVNAFLRDSSFTCNIRHLAEAYGTDKVWNMQYSVTPGWHGTDLFPVFYNPKITATSWKLTIGTFFLPVVGLMVSGISQGMQSYFTSFVTEGDPNAERVVWNVPPTVEWRRPGFERGGGMDQTIEVGNWGFGRVVDGQVDGEACRFWGDVAVSVTEAGGYGVPGVDSRQGIVRVEGDRKSERFIGGNKWER